MAVLGINSKKSHKALIIEHGTWEVSNAGSYTYSKNILQSTMPSRLIWPSAFSM